MSKLLKSHAVSLPEIKNHQGRKFDELCRVRTCICKESKIEKLIIRKVVEKARLIINNEKQYPFQFVSSDCDFRDALLILISLNMRET